MVLQSVAGGVISPKVSRWSWSNLPVCHTTSHSCPAPLQLSGWWGSKQTWKTDPSACPCLAEATSITLRRGGWMAGVSMAPCPKLSWHLLHHQPRWWMHIQELPSHRQELAQGLPLAHPWTPAVLREKKPPRILQFKFSCVMSRAKCHEAWDCLLSHHL